MPQHFLGVDGGQSSTTAVVGDETGRILGIGRAGPCNHVSAEESRAKFISVIDECVQAACTQASLSRSTRFAAACLGFSGGPADKEAILREIISSDQTIVTDDALIALAGATAGQPGIIAVAGTGSIAFGRNAAGQTARAGGWGYIFGDEGSAFDIVRQGLRAALRFEEGWGPSTALRSVLLERIGARDINDLLHLFYTPEFPRSRIAALSKLVDQTAEDGDAVAREILVEASRQLAMLARAVRSQLFRAGEEVLVSYLGGVFGSGTLLGHFRTLVDEEPGTYVTPPVHGPAAGALLEAYRAAGIPCTLSNVPQEKP